MSDTKTVLVESGSEQLPVEHITWKGQHIATVIRSRYLPQATTFVTPDGFYQQAGFVVYPKGGEIKRHMHIQIQRHLVGTPETLLVKRGKLYADLYDFEKQPLKTVLLEEGDIILLVGGGHGFRCIEDTVLFELKQGPFTGLKEKELF